MREGYEALRKARLDEFMAGFSCISLKLKEMYQMITLGGDAELELVDSLDPFSEVSHHRLLHQECMYQDWKNGNKMTVLAGNAELEVEDL